MDRPSAAVKLRESLQQARLELEARAWEDDHEALLALVGRLESAVGDLIDIAEAAARQDEDLARLRAESDELRDALKTQRKFAHRIEGMLMDARTDLASLQRSLQARNMMP